jgi:hypothetical protein
MNEVCFDLNGKGSHGPHYSDSKGKPSVKVIIVVK